MAILSTCLPMRSDRIPGYGCNVLRNRIFWTYNLLYLISRILLIFILHLQSLDSSWSRFRNNLGITAGPPLSIHQRRRYSCCPIGLSCTLSSLLSWFLLSLLWNYDTCLNIRSVNCHIKGNLTSWLLFQCQLMQLNQPCWLGGGP